MIGCFTIHIVLQNKCQKNKTEKIDFKGRKQRKCVKRARWNNTLLDIS